jgi:uncharacterized membrane protein YiaA
MATTHIPELSAPTTIRWSSVIQLIFSVLAAFLLLGAALLIVLSNAFLYLTNPSGSRDITQSFMIAGSLAFVGALVLPSAWYAWKDIAYPQHDAPPKPEPKGFGLILTVVVFVVVSVSLLLGNLVAQNTKINWLVLPILNIIATGLPTLWIVYLGIRGLPSGPPKTRWGILAIGLVISPLIILVLELILLVLSGFLALLLASLDPNLSNQLTNLALRIENVGPNPDALLRILAPFIVSPGIIFLIFALVSMIVPIVEETLKPLGVWSQAGQKITPARGFAFGVLCGAAFGLFENLGNTSGSGEAWALLATTRITTLLLHSFTAGMMGWALASAWSERRFLRLGLTYAFAIMVHGLWNGMALLSAAPSLQGISNISIPVAVQQLSTLASIGIVALGAFILVFYIRFNAILRQNLTRSTAMPSDVTGMLNPVISELSQGQPGKSVSSSELHLTQDSAHQGDAPPNSQAGGKTSSRPEENPATNGELEP